MSKEMTDAEALVWCEGFIDNLVRSNVKGDKFTLGLRAMQKCKEALKKQIPEQPTVDIYDDETFAYICPCGRELIEGQYNCDLCGQKLDWQSYIKRGSKNG